MSVRHSPDNRSLRTSVVLHLAVFLLISLFFIIKSCAPKNEVHVFQLTEVPQDKRKSTPKNTRIVEEKQSTPVAQKEAQKIKPSLKKIDYESFIKENPIKKSVTDQTPTKSKLPNIKLKSLSEEPSNYSDSKAEQILDGYQKYLYRTINTKWVKPQSSNNHLGLYVTVEFTVLNNGSIQSVQVLDSSGNRLFDQSVLSVFKTIKRFNAPPDKQSRRFKMTFRVDA
jgi:TonB family protein